MSELSSLMDALDLAQVGDGRFRATNATVNGAAVVFGGQLLAQSLVAGASVDPAKSVRSVQLVFARGAAPEADLEIDVEPMASGRAFSSSTVTIRQGERLCTRALVLLSADEPDLIRHQDPAPAVGPPEDSPANPHSSESWQVRTVDAVDVFDPELVGPPELAVWSRFEGAPDPGEHQNLNRALLAYATDGFLIGTALRPHQGYGLSMAHVSIATTVNGHSISFFEPVDAGRWSLLDHRSPSAGHGRTHGTAKVHDEDGLLVASFSQDNMARSMPST